MGIESYGVRNVPRAAMRCWSTCRWELRFDRMEAWRMRHTRRSFERRPPIILDTYRVRGRTATTGSQVMILPRIDPSSLFDPHH